MSEQNGREPDELDEGERFLDEDELMELGALQARYQSQRSWVRTLVFVVSLLFGATIHLFYMVTRRQQAVVDAREVSHMFEARLEREREARRLDVAHLGRQRTECLRLSTARTARCEQCVVDRIQRAFENAPGTSPASVLSAEGITRILADCKGPDRCPP